MDNIFHYKRRKSSVVAVGTVPMGGENPIRLQSMTNTSTLDTEGCVRQCISIIEAGGEYVRLTAQGVREAENLRNIRNGLHSLGYSVPLVADIHFNPKAANTAASIVEKVRINPGNFADPVKTFQTFEYSDEEYESELRKIRERFLPFLSICRENGTAIRIGVNHGSLSDRIMSRYGDTPEGMVESCMEFLRICVEENFYNTVISIKASNTFMMVETVRLLVRQMDSEGMKFPLHLGVTESGDGEEGRIKSSVGIGTLLLEGIGDTIRVSLSEAPEAEIPVARLLTDYVIEKEQLPILKTVPAISKNDVIGKSVAVGNIGGDNVPVVISDYLAIEDLERELIPDFIYSGKCCDLPENINKIVDFSSFTPAKNCYPLFTIKEKEDWKKYDQSIQFLRLSYSECDEEFFTVLKEKAQTILIVESENHHIYEQKALVYLLRSRGIFNPVIVKQSYQEQNPESFQIKSATDCGFFFLDRLADGIWLTNQEYAVSSQQTVTCSFNILQATGRRISKTEYISCPSCGRTLFDLQTAIRKVKQATADLKGLKIAIMGCIVNGPGEMADADYGYVGAGKGKVSLYKGKECLMKNIPEENAVEELIKLIRGCINSKN
ncbi:MAG: (E)-4-hydroxy-3-methylbut-2-enyl-diphosphate synthase [Dysgonamonadaceae bacterium]|nr:(E)-4-hydroxy-3-methylbut-2-enyl-diphosphate synthase [Dysgonamonadaceae bacterium]